MKHMTQTEFYQRSTPCYAELCDAQRSFVRIDGLYKHYVKSGLFGTKTVRSLDGVTLRIGKGEVLGLVGESGCGKSTLAKVLTRLTAPSGGQIEIDGEDWLAPQGEALRRRRRDVQLVFQDPGSALDGRMTIGESMSAPLAAHGIGTPRDRTDRVMAMLDEVGLDASFYARKPRQCSGGQLQRVVIGRALLLEPQLLVCDEPTSALDASMRTQILNLLLDLKQKRGLTMLMISHDLRVVRYLSDRIAVMYLGAVVETADRDALFNDPQHPYTKALIASSLLERGQLSMDRFLRDGDLPSPLDMPPGCRFEKRCPFARPDCGQREPALRLSGEGHFVACRYYDQLEAV